ncbi:uncharacterized protein LOC131167533 [Malania oleifera]|uniref:uncharacterized protein LOC131167533 n=1 Tax=Malania oleifera TaxID=397392 RepID=UPI0025AE2C01|nr:uncharacterized protein LOC131167533 [Malania oleifera]
MFAQGQSMDHPPKLCGTNYPAWKDWMSILIHAYDYRTWNVITEGDYTLKNEEGDDIPIGKLPKVDAKLAQLNFKTKNFLYCAMNNEECNRICGCNMAKEIWEKLQVTYEGTTQVKKSKIYMLVQEYEMFKMEESETITALFTHFTHITNGLKAFGREYSMEDNV